VKNEITGGTGDKHPESSWTIDGFWLIVFLEVQLATDK